MEDRSARRRCIAAALAAGLGSTLVACAPTASVHDTVREEILADVAAVGDVEVGTAYTGRPDHPSAVLDLYLPVIDEANVISAVEESARIAWERWDREPGDVSIRIFEGDVVPDGPGTAPLSLSPFSDALKPAKFVDQSRGLELGRDVLMERFGPYGG